MAKYEFFDHGNWAQATFQTNTPTRVGDGLYWTTYRSNAANFHGGVLLSVVGNILAPAGTPPVTQGTPTRDRTNFQPYPNSQLIELLDYTGTDMQGDLAGANVYFADGKVEIIKPYTIGQTAFYGRLTDAELQTLWDLQQARSPREKLMQLPLYNVPGGSLSAEFAAYKQFLAGLFGATRAEQLLVK
jgi:hypothetical protein